MAGCSCSLVVLACWLKACYISFWLYLLFLNRDIKNSVIRFQPCIPMEKCAAWWQGGDEIPSSTRGLIGWVYNKPSGWVKHLPSCKYQYICVGRDSGHLSPTSWPIRCAEGHYWSGPGASEVYPVCEARTQRCYSHSDTNRTVHMKLAVMPSLQTSPHRSLWSRVKSTLYSHHISLFITLSTRAEVQGGQDMTEQA